MYKLAIISMTHLKNKISSQSKVITFIDESSATGFMNHVNDSEYPISNVKVSALKLF